ncbi:hypothetical protein HZA43_01345 [Candidatus Peregrinibacteria bacterium]|nr:hypothetical protein [Candidatus Peregrinibacteria bacterium]
MNPLTKLPLNEELVPVREAQKNITKYFKRGITRVTRNGRSLGYMISDAMLEEMIEQIEQGNPAFIKRMEAIARHSKKTTPLKEVMKEYGL